MTYSLTDQALAKQQSINSSFFSGAILGLQGDVLHGWAMDNMQPEERPIVEIFIDGVSVALARADRYEPGAPSGDQYHGFIVQLRQRWLDDAKAITVRIANQPITLEGKILLPVAVSSDTAEITSQVWHTGGLRIGGWCWDPKRPSRHVKITVREGDRLITEVICNEHNQALAYRATSDHGFAIDLPWELADGKVHSLDLINDHGQALSGSPIRVCCRPEGIVGLISQLNLEHELATKELLLAIAEEQSIRLPKSASWETYPKWFSAFQLLDEKNTPNLQGRIGLLLISEGNTSLENISLGSLGTNRSDIHELVIAPPTNLAPSLEILISAGCDRILPIHSGDRLAAFALPYLSALIDNGSSWAYSDCDRDGPENERNSPWLKPTWDIDLFIGADIFMHGAIFSIDTVKSALEVFKKNAEDLDMHWHDFTTSVALSTHLAKSIVTHLPRVLYHRTQDAPTSPEQAAPSVQRLEAVKRLCESLAPGTTVAPIRKYPSLLEAKWPLPKKLPLVSLIVPTRDQVKLLRACIDGLLFNTNYENLEIIIVDNQSTDPETLCYLEELKLQKVTVLSHPYPFNYSTINNKAVDIARGEIIGLINNDIEVIEPNWLKTMVAQLLRPNVGVVGAKLLWPNEMVQHAGVTVGINGLAAHSGNKLHKDDAGYLAYNQLTRRQSAVTAACMLIKKSDFVEKQGLDELNYPVAFNDVDLCLRMTISGKPSIWVASALLTHAESASRGKDVSAERRSRAEREQLRFYNTWSYLDDRYYHPGLSHDYLTGPYGGLALPYTKFAPRQSLP
jgi:GT2 family glycosyltransferase